LDSSPILIGLFVGFIIGFLKIFKKNFLGGTWICTEGFMLARQVLLLLEPLHQPLDINPLSLFF
jgi:hypothetical protein